MARHRLRRRALAAGTVGSLVGVLFYVAMAGLPLPAYLSVLLGFALSRLFDILKPWPVASIERGVSGGLGVMLDDVMAGLYALTCLQILRHWFGIL